MAITAASMGGLVAGAEAGPTDRRLVVLYDRDCTFCSWTARQLLGMDRHRRLEFVALQEAAGSGRPALVQAALERPLLTELHVIDEADGRVSAGGQAMLEILFVLPGGRWFRPWAALPLVRPLIERLYLIVARNRHRIGGWLGLDPAACVLPRQRRGSTRRAGSRVWQRPT